MIRKCWVGVMIRREKKLVLDSEHMSVCVCVCGGANTD